ncbi:MAG: DUF2635 domain-containing protein, partial [Gammaproteobacteria bacterium]|nr:DUF2635 domain-containing protein [Gammaproteobacteria bacterium]
MTEYSVFLIPQFGLPVRDPWSKVLMLETGEVKPLTGKEGRYWRRRINDGSVKILEQPKPRRSVQKIKED